MMKEVSAEERAKRKEKQVFDLNSFEVVNLEKWAKNRRLKYEDVERKHYEEGWTLKEIEQGYMEKDKFKDFT